MRLLRVAVEHKRWDLAAHTIILATATVLSDGHKTGTIKGKANKSSLKQTAAKVAMARILSSHHQLVGVGVRNIAYHKDTAFLWFGMV